MKHWNFFAIATVPLKLMVWFRNLLLDNKRERTLCTVKTILTHFVYLRYHLVFYSAFTKDILTKGYDGRIVNSNIF